MIENNQNITMSAWDRWDFDAIAAELDKRRKIAFDWEDDEPDLYDLEGMMIDYFFKNHPEFQTLWNKLADNERSDTIHFFHYVISSPIFIEHMIQSNGRLYLTAAERDLLGDNR